MNRTLQEKGELVVQAACAQALATDAHKAPLGLRTVAVFEFIKGMVVLLAGVGFFLLIHHDVQSEAEELVKLLHLNPAHHNPRIFIDMAANLNDSRLWAFGIAALVYAAVRFVETYGLWHERAWAEWFAVISAGLYLPVELDHLYRDHTMLSLLVPLINIGIIIYLAWLLAKSNAKKKHEAAKRGDASTID